MHGLSKHSHQCLRQTNVSPFVCLLGFVWLKYWAKNEKRRLNSLLCTSLAHAEEGSREDTSLELYIIVQFVSWLFGSGTFKLGLHWGAVLMDECADCHLWMCFSG